MRENVRNYNLAGMGCSAGVVSVDLAKDLLKTHPNSTALVISTENITQNWYRSNQRVRHGHAFAPRRPSLGAMACLTCAGRAPARTTNAWTA